MNFIRFKDEGSTVDDNNSETNSDIGLLHH